MRTAARYDVLGHADSADRGPAVGRVRVHRGGGAAAGQGGPLGAGRGRVHCLVDRDGRGVWALTGAEPFGEHGYGVHLFEWIPAGEFVVNVGFFIDNLTACLLIVVTTIGLLVHVYSVGYMSHDPGYWRFFAYLNLFMFSMLLLVLADSFLAVFVAWELVGLSQLPADRVLVPQAHGGARGQEGVHRQPGRRRRLRARDHAHLRQPRHARHPRGDRADRRARRRRPSLAISLLIFAGAMGKSAQFPLHVWLPDAMEGPTPGLRPDPCGHHGQRRRLPRRPHQPDLRARARGARRGRRRSGSSRRSWRHRSR